MRAAAVVVGLSGLAVSSAEAQVRPFAYSIATGTGDADREGRRATAYFDTGYTDRTSEPLGYDGLEQRIGFQGRLGKGLTVVAHVAFGLDAQATRASEDAELLQDLLSSSRFHLAIGAGGRREWSGSATALGRLSVGWTGGSTLLCGNLRVEKPFSPGRDTVDVISSLGVMHLFARGLRVGFEAVGEDLEGFWDATEAEGGATLYAGPALHWTAPNRRLWASLGGGPVLHATHTGLSSPAPRDLQAAAGYTIRASIGYTF